VCAVRGREGVIDVDLAQARELVGKGRVVLLLAGMEAQVLQQRHATFWQRIDHGLRLPPNAILGKSHLAAEHAAQRLGDGGQRHRALALTLGPAEMG
jgi:hypothetical protein